MARQPLLESHFPGLPCRRGKVRDVYDLGDRLVIVATDRISAFDWVLPTAIPDKGCILTALSLFWFDFLKVPHHLLATDPREMGPPFSTQADVLTGRTMLVKKTRVVPIECVVRGYLAGSGWKEYRQDGTVCGIRLPAGLQESQQLPEPIFTPATKEEHGHDVNISFERMAELVGQPRADELRRRSVDIYCKAADFARSKGILIADTKFEWGSLPFSRHPQGSANVTSPSPHRGRGDRGEGDCILIDEVLTPDSSRFWPLDQYRPGSSPPSFDKQFVRNWLETTAWDKNSPPPALPADVVAHTRQKYLDAYERLTGKKLNI